MIQPFFSVPLLVLGLLVAHVGGAAPASGDTLDEVIEAYEQGDHEAAIALVNEAVAANSLGRGEFEDAIAIRGMARYHLGEIELAIADLESVASLMTLSIQPSALAWLALAQAETGALEAALATIGAAQRSDPSAWDVFLHRADINDLLGRPDLAAGDTLRAATFDAASAFPNREAARHFVRYHGMSLLTEEELAALAAIAADEADPFLLALGGYVANLGAMPQGLAMLERAAQQSTGTAFTWDLLGLARFQVGDASGAVEAFEAGLAADPQDARALLLLAAARLVEGGDPMDVLRAQDEAVPLEPVIGATIASFPLLADAASRERIVADATNETTGYDWQLRTFALALALIEAGQAEAATKALHVAIFSRSYTDPLLYTAAVCLRQVYGLP